jgi:hypothetical protein
MLELGQLLGWLACLQHSIRLLVCVQCSAEPKAVSVVKVQAKCSTTSRMMAQQQAAAVSTSTSPQPASLIHIYIVGVHDTNCYVLKSIKHMRSYNAQHTVHSTHLPVSAAGPKWPVSKYLATLSLSALRTRLASTSKFRSRASCPARKVLRAAARGTGSATAQCCSMSSTGGSSWWPVLPLPCSSTCPTALLKCDSAASVQPELYQTCACTQDKRML